MTLTRKELDKTIKIYLKKLKKKYGYSSRDIVLYKKIKEYFVTITIYATGRNNNIIRVIGNIKLYFLDDIFWEVFQMPDNSDAPMGLRANGAFKMWGLQIYDTDVQVENYDSVESILENLLNICNDRLTWIVECMGCNFRKFIDYSKTIENRGLFNPVLAEMLLDINEQHYLEAIKIVKNEIENGRYGNLKNHGKDIYEHILQFCESKTDKKYYDYR